MLGYDYAWGRPSPAALRRAGARFVCRYLSHDASKDISGRERRYLHAAGIAVVLNWETTADRMLGGEPAGRADGAEALGRLRQLGAPPTVACYFSADFDAQPDQLPAVGAYLRGAAVSIPAARLGVYGGLRVVRAMLDRGAVAYGWQTYAWSGGQWDKRAQLRQVHNGVKVGGADCDLDVATVAAFGQWAPKRPPRLRYPVWAELLWRTGR